MTNTFNKTAVAAVDRACKTVRVEGWGIVLTATDELDALRIAYKYRNAKHGCKIDNNEATGYWGVTVWNENAKAMGCDC